MKKNYVYSLLFPLLIFAMAGCGPIGRKSSSISSIYGIAAILSLLLLIGYFTGKQRKEVWFVLMLSSVSVVNIGYYFLSVSETLEQALMANRLSYLGSVFLPMCMLLIILNTTRIRYAKWFPAILITLGVFVFWVAASPGYLPIYYKEVSLEIVNGTSMLHKTYGSWHSLYLFYLLGYFSAMIWAILYAIRKKKAETPAHAAIITIAVAANLGVWLIEQMVKIDFEILSISYIISECFLLALNVYVLEIEKAQKELLEKNPAPAIPSTPVKPESTMSEEEFLEKQAIFNLGIQELTKTERLIFDYYIVGKNTRQIMETLNIKENTLKFHNKNIYSKLGVSSRRQLLEIYRLIQIKKEEHP